MDNYHLVIQQIYSIGFYNTSQQQITNTGLLLTTQEQTDGTNASEIQLRNKTAQGKVAMQQSLQLTI